MVESRISQIIEGTVEDLGFRLVRILFSGAKTGRAQLQIMAEPLENREMTVEDCETLSRNISALLEVEDPIASAYTLEVSSPGIDRPLTRLEDYTRFSGEAPRSRCVSCLMGVNASMVGLVALMRMAKSSLRQVLQICLWI